MDDYTYRNNPIQTEETQHNEVKILWVWS